MKATFPRLLFFSIAALGLAEAAAHATNLGYNTNPGGSAFTRRSANTGFAFYDTFPSLTFANAPATDSFGLTNPIFAQSQTIDTNPATSQGNGLYTKYSGTPDADNLDGESFFGGNSPVSFTLSGQVSFTIRGVVLQIKRPNSTGGLDSGTVIIKPRLSINGGTGLLADSTSVTSAGTSAGDPAASNGSYSVTSYYWNNSIASLPSNANNTFAVQINGSTSSTDGDVAIIQRGIDGMSIDVGPAAAVPEPISGTLLASGLGLLMTRRRRRLDG